MRKILPPAICLLAGLACLCAVYGGYTRAGVTDIYFQLVPVSGNERSGLALRFTNVGEREVALDITGMEYFVLPSHHRPALHTVFVRSGHQNATGPGVRPAASRLPPGESLVVGDLVGALAGLPPGEAILQAVYFAEGAGDSWRGTVRSFPLKFAVGEPGAADGRTRNDDAHELRAGTALTR